MNTDKILAANKLLNAAKVPDDNRMVHPVTPKAEPDCRTCKLYANKSGGCTSVGVCSEQYFMYQPSQPVRLYTRESK
jgi:hypothetical protein